jgi:sarcosine oxidase subunit beta
VGGGEARAVICGAGIAGISAAYHLSVRRGWRDVVLVDPRPPLSLTSDKSTECYRNWWPGPGDGMVRLMNRSIGLLEELAKESGNSFNLNRRGYLFATARQEKLDDFIAAAKEAEALGAGPLRLYPGGTLQPTYRPNPQARYNAPLSGADVITDQQLLKEHFPFLSPDTVGVLHARRAGWLSAQQYGMYLLRKAQEGGARLLPAQVRGVDLRGGEVAAVRITDSSGERKIHTKRFVIAAGPMLRSVGEMIGLQLPVFSELHAKISFSDHLGAMPRNAPLVIWADAQRLPWTETERSLLAQSSDTQWLLEEFPAQVHGRPEGPADGATVLLLWTYDERPVEPTLPPSFDDFYYPEIVLRGMSTALPAFRRYFDRLPKPFVDGGYYTKTKENRPLIGPLPVPGAFVIGALSGFGIMASAGAGELLAAHMTDSPLPDYAHWFQIDRYQDPEYQEMLERWDRSGQI